MTPSIAVASALIPQILPLIQPAIKWAIQGVEHIFGGSTPGGTKTGPIKFSTVEAFATQLITGLITQGKISSVIDPLTIAQMIENTVQLAKSDGTIPSASGTVPKTVSSSTVTSHSTPQSSAIAKGQVIQISGTISLG